MDDDEEYQLLREIGLPDGRIVYVPEAAYPVVMEWDWHYDDASQQVVRVERGKKIYLFNELSKRLRRNAKDNPLLSRAAVRALFGHVEAYRQVLLLSMSQRDTTMEEDIETPSAHELVVHSLSFALREYFTWRDTHEEVVFTPDANGIIPGVFMTAPIPANRSYRTLGEWLTTTLTGDYVPNDVAGTGMVPETRADALMPEIRRIWRFLLRETNYGKVNVKKVQKLLRAGERPAADMADWLYEVIESYPLPEIVPLGT